MANILLISYLFAPLNSIACRRLYAWAKYLKELGHNVIVLTADTPDDKRMKNFDVDFSELEIHRLRYFDIRSLAKKIFKRIKDFLLKLQNGNISVELNQEYIVQFSQKRHVEKLNQIINSHLEKAKNRWL